jgi:hypothetical protein
MDQSSHQPLAGPGLALDEHRWQASAFLVPQQPPKTVPDGHHGRAFSKQLVDGVHARIHF